MTREREEIIKRALTYLEQRFGEIHVEISEIYTYSKTGVVEVSGSFKRRTDSIKRRFTIKMRMDNLEVVAFGLR